MRMNHFGSIFGVAVAALLAGAVESSAGKPAKPVNQAAGKPASSTAAKPADGTTAHPAAASAASASEIPSFSLPDLDGKIWNSGDFAGKPLIVDFWATWCNTCKETVPKLAELQEKYKARGLTVVGISVDKGSAEKIRKTAKKLGINYLVLLDKDNTLAASFGFKGIPSVYVFDKRGKMNTAMPGYDPDQEAQLSNATEKILL
jgi:cytochrome c biogenesis protein CcmG, thiol:disulfide interchange protein DsbE